MAKQKEKTVDRSALDDVLAKLLAEQNKVVPGSAVSGKDMFADVKIFIPTSSIILDTIISNKEQGGWPAGRTIELYGEESIGKSTLAFAAMAQVQMLGGLAIYYDVEQAGSREMMKANGVDVNRLIISNLTSIEEIFATLEVNLTSIIGIKELKGKPIFVCMDSLAQMSSDDEIEGGYEHNMNVDLKKPKQLGKAIRKITPLLNKANACLMIINQLRDKPGTSYGDPTTTPGGKALKFAASIRIKLEGKTPVKIMDPTAEVEYRNKLTAWEEDCATWKQRGGSKGTGKPKPEKPKKSKGDEIIIGYDIIAKTVKNKIAPPKREAEFRIIFTKGIIEEPAWLDYSIKYGLVETSGNSYTFKIPNFPDVGEFRREQWFSVLSEVEVHDYIRTNVKTRLIKPLNEEDIIAMSSDDGEDDLPEVNTDKPNYFPKPATEEKAVEVTETEK